MQSEPDERYQHASEVQTAVHGIGGAKETPVARRPRRTPLIVGSVAIAPLRVDRPPAPRNVVKHAIVTIDGQHV